MDDLTDLELCKRIAEIEGNKVVFDEFNDKQVKILIQTWCDTDSCYFDDYLPYSPLTDDGLCFQLMVKYKVLITWQDFNDNCTAVIDGASEDIPFTFAIADVNDKSPNKAICLAIIEANKGGE